MSDASSGAGQVLLPQIAQAYQNDPRTALVRSLLAQGQQNLTATPTYNTGSALAKALTIGLGAISNQQLTSQYQDQNAAAQNTLKDALSAAQGTPASTNPDTGEVTPAKPGSLQAMISALGSNPATAPQALQLQTSIAQNQAQARAALVAELAKSGLTLSPDGSGVSAIPGYGSANASIVGQTEAAKANAGVPAALATSLGSKGLVPDGNGGVTLLPGYAPGVAGVAGATKGAEASATNASDLNYKPLIAGQTAAATLPTDVFKDYVKPQTVRPGGAVVGPMGSLANVMANLPSGQGAGGAPTVQAPGGSPLASALAGPPPAAPAPMGAPGSPSSPGAVAALQALPGANQQLPPVPPNLQAQLNAPGAPAAPVAPAPSIGTPPAGATQVAASVTPVPHAPAGPAVIASNDGGAMNAAKTNEELYKEYQNYATNNPTLAQNLRNAADTFKYFQSGQSAPMQAQAAAWAKAAGIDPDKLNLADPAQVSLAQKSATQALFSQMAGAKNPALGEYNMLQSAVAGPALQPEAAKSIIANSLAKVAYQNDHFQEMANYRQQNGSMAGYDPSPFIVGAGARMPQYIDQAMQSLPTFKGEQVLPQHAPAPAPALTYLKANDSPSTRAAFDLKYGHGAAATALGGQ